MSTRQPYFWLRPLAAPFVTTRSATRPAPQAQPPSNALERALFGYRIPFLPPMFAQSAPDVRHNLERITTILDFWSEFVARLWPWYPYRCAFSLRFLSQQANGLTDIVLLAQIHAAVGEGKQAGFQLAQHLTTQLTRFDNLQLEPLASQQIARYLSPFAGQRLPMEVTEVRQLDLQRLEVGYHKVYEIRPFWRAGGDGATLFDLLKFISTPILVNIHLEPTTLLLAEQRVMAETISHMQSLASSAAQRIALLYTAIAQNLQKPFLLTVQVAGLDRAAVNRVAQTAGEGIIAANQVATQIGQLPLSEYKLKPLVSNNDYDAAYRTMTELELTDWGADSVQPGYERLRYLMSAQGASSAFRLPISLANGISGIATQPPPAQSAPEIVLNNEDRAWLLNEFKNIMTFQLQDNGSRISFLSGAGLLNWAVSYSWVLAPLQAAYLLLDLATRNGASASLNQADTKALGVLLSSLVQFAGLEIRRRMAEIWRRYNLSNRSPDWD